MEKRDYRLSLFMVLALVFAFIYEEAPRAIIHDIPGALHLWEIGANWLPFFLIWYGVLFLICYLVFIKKKIHYPVIFGILYGLVFETFYFRKMENIFSFILFLLLYFGMFYFPFKIMKIIYDKEKFSKSELIMVIISQTFAFALLSFISLAAK